MKLYVDDVRPAPAGWQVARTVKQAIQFLEDHAVQEVSLDFMIGDRYEQNFSPVAHHIASMPKEKRPKKIYIHTSSPSGAIALRRILEGHVEEIIRA